MPILKDPKHELYAQHRAKGKTQVEAYELAGYAPDDGNATRFETVNDRIRPRIKELLEKSAELALVDNKWVLEKFKELAERCLTAVPVLDDEGNETGEWKFEHSGASKALENIGKYVGFYEKDNGQRSAITFKVVDYSAAGEDDSSDE